MVRCKPFEIINAEDVSETLLTRVNALIDEYNTTADIPRKKELLQTIQQKIKIIDHHLPNEQIEKSPQYRALRTALFKEVKYQLESMGQHSMLDLHADTTPLEDVIANMAPEKTDQLLAILRKGPHPELDTELNALYSAEDTSPEARTFRKFLTTHEIGYLGGGNSKNYKVKNLDTGRELVLKVDNRLNTPRNIEDDLREKVSETFAPIYTEREATFVEASGEAESRTILVTEYYKTGNLKQECSKFTKLNKGKPIDDLVAHECALFEQMAKTMERIERAGCIFPDAKITNWLIDSRGNICISDTKSMAYTDEKGMFVLSQAGNEHAKLLFTPGYNPPEITDPKHLINANSLHAFILGKNLYTYATGRATVEADGEKLDFAQPIFMDPKGIELQTLIKALVKPNPADRMPVQEAQTELFMISHPDFRKVFADLNALKIGDHDDKMDLFIHKKQQQLRDGSPEERETIVKELQQLAHDLHSDRALQEVKGIVQQYREKAGLLTVGMNTKADKIELALAEVPVEKRTDFIHSKESTKVIQELAVQRLRHRLHQSPNPENLAKVCSELKAKYEKLTKEPESGSPGSDIGHSSPP